MKLYSIRKGKYYSNGNKYQPIAWPILTLITGVILAFILKIAILILPTIIITLLFLLNNKKNTFVFSKRVSFTNSCLYKLDENYDQVNKLFGFSEGFHHWNSARIGWRCLDGKTIELLAYSYIDGVRTIKHIMSCKPNNWVFCNIQNQDSKYIFKVFTSKDKIATVVIDKNPKRSFYSLFKLFIYNLYPYFGGKIPSPKNMNIYMITLK